MACGGDWKHLALLRYVQLSDGMEVGSWGRHREVWEGEMLFTEITLTLWEVEVCLPPCILFLCLPLFFFLSTCLVSCLTLVLLVCFFSLCAFLTLFAQSSTHFVFISL